MKSSSPKRISKFFRWFCKEDFYEELQGDLNELFQRRVNKYGKRGANFIYLFDVLTFFQPFVWKNPLTNLKLFNNNIMFNHYFKVGIRNMRRNKAFSLISLLSLVLGFVPTILALLYLQHEFSYDHFHQKADRIYLVLMQQRNKQQEFTAQITSPYIAEAIKNEFPGVQKVTRLTPSWEGAAVFTYNEKHIKEDGLLYADANVFEVFDIPFVQGNPKTALANPFSIVVTEAMAQKYFGTENPMGKMIHNNIFINFVSKTGWPPPPAEEILQVDILLQGW